MNRCDTTPVVRTPAIPGPAPRGVWAWRCLAVALCALHAFVARHTMNPDGVSYLDVADACARGQWSACLNPYWSPLYPWLLAATLVLVRPTAYWECAAVHGLNFLLFLGALAAFEFFLAEWLRARPGDDGHDDRALPGWALAGLAYAVFAWICRRLVTVSFVTPDMCVAALVFLAAALTLRIRRLGPSPARSAGLGVTLGTAYLAKAVMFPLGFVFLAASAIAAGPWQRAVRHLAAATTAFGLIAGGFIAALSVSRGYVTFGDSGRLNYAWYVAGLPRPHAPADAGPAGRPEHPPRRLLEAPAVYEFAAPVGGTYPLWYDPAYWYQGIRPAVGAAGQLRALGRTAAAYFSLLGEQLLGLTGAVTLLCLFTLLGGAPWWRSLGRFLARLVSQYPILVPAAGAIGIYSLVGHVEGRLIGPFLVLALAGVLAAVRVPRTQEAATGRLACACLVVVAALLAVNLVFDAGNAATALARGEAPAAHPEWQAARALHDHGLRPGDRVAFVGFTFDAYWARLGGYHIVAEVPENQAERFWAEDGPGRAAVLEAFRRAGARAVVVRHAPGSDWSPVPGTGYAFRVLPGQRGSVRVGTGRPALKDGPTRSATSPVNGARSIVTPVHGGSRAAPRPAPQGGPARLSGIPLLSAAGQGRGENDAPGRNPETGLPGSARRGYTSEFARQSAKGRHRATSQEAR
jgi:hypothetical protein